MSTSYSNSLKLALIGTGDQSGTWGTTTNTNFGTLLEQAITGVTPINLAGLSAYTLTNYNGTSDDARNAVLVFTGSAIGSPTVITAPLVNKLYTVVNLSTQTVQMTATGGSVSLNIPANMSTLCYCDASNATGAGSGFYTQITGVPGAFTATNHIGPGTGLTGTASGLSIGGNAATATTATNATNATYASNPASGGSFITSSNIGSQSVNYASSAGSASVAGSLSSTLGVSLGGSGASSLSGYLFGNGTSPFTAENFKVGTNTGGATPGSSFNVVTGASGNVFLILAVTSGFTSTWSWSLSINSTSLCTIAGSALASGAYSTYTLFGLYSGSPNTTYSAIVTSPNGGIIYSIMPYVYIGF